MLEYMCYMRPIRASDIGTYLYCRRAWWYRQQGFEVENQAELAAGAQIHRQHGRQVLLAGLMRALALILFLAALALLAAYCTVRLI